MPDDKPVLLTLEQVNQSLPLTEAATVPLHSSSTEPADIRHDLDVAAAKFAALITKLSTYFPELRSETWWAE